MKDKKKSSIRSDRNWDRVPYDSTTNFLRREKGLVLTVAGVFLILIGSIVPIAYDYYGDLRESRSFLNNITALIILVAFLLLISFLAIYLAIIDSVKIAKSISIALLAISIIIMLIGIVFVVAWTAAIINKEFGFGPGLYVMFTGDICIFAGSIIYFREKKKLCRK